MQAKFKTDVEMNTPYSVLSEQEGVLNEYGDVNGQSYTILPDNSEFHYSDVIFPLYGEITRIPNEYLEFID